jgi:hypothetical protein
MRRDTTEYSFGTIALKPTPKTNILRNGCDLS